MCDNTFEAWATHRTFLSWILVLNLVSITFPKRLDSMRDAQSTSIFPKCVVGRSRIFYLNNATAVGNGPISVNFRGKRGIQRLDSNSKYNKIDARIGAR